jgi:hypothetical protein
MPVAPATMRSRPPAVAGQFYPGSPERLSAEVRSFLAAAPEHCGAAIKAVIAPHAGYVYSGPVAAAAFAAVRDRAATIARVVVIGPAHYVAVRGVAAPTVEAFDTPLGRVPLDRAGLDALSNVPWVIASDVPHVPEHALEVELPFLQTLLRSFVLVPLLVGDAAPQEVAETLERVWGGEETLIVVSSDLSHYLDYDRARRRDRATAAAIEQLDWTRLGPDDACGVLPICGLLIQARRRGLKPARLALCNSGDTAGGRDRVVGYGAWAFGPA